MNRIATIMTWTDLWQVYMLCSLIGISLSAISQKTSRCKLKLNKLFLLAVFCKRALRRVPHRKNTKGNGKILVAGKRLNLGVRGPGEKPSWGETRSSGTGGSHPGQES